MSDPAFTLFRCLCQFPYTSDYKFNRRIAAISIFSQVIFTSLALVTEFLASRLGFNKLVDNFLGISRCVAHALCLAINLYELISKNRRFTRILSFIRPESRLENRLVLIATAAFSLVSSYMFLAIPSGRFRFDRTLLLIWSLFHNASLFMNMCVLMQFCILCDTLRHKLRQIDDNLANNFRIAIVQHSKIVRATKLMNKLYGPQLIIISIVVFLNMTTYLHYLITTWSNGVTNQILFNSACVIYYGCQIVKMTAESDRVVQQGRKFYIHLLKVMMTDGTKKIRLYLTMNEQICFTANGYFHVGRPLLTSMVAAATSYLFILANLDN